MGWRNIYICKLTLFLQESICMDLFWRISDSQFLSIHNLKNIDQICWACTICPRTIKKYITDGLTDWQTHELILVGLGNLCFLQVYPCLFRLWFLKKYTDTQICIRTQRKISFRGCIMIISWFFCDFVGALASRYEDTQIGVPAFSPLTHASSLK